MSKFEIRRADNGETYYKGNAARHVEFRNTLLSIRGQGVIEQGRYFVAGKEVSFEIALQAAKDAGEAALAKKQKTHRQITYFDGVCGPFASNTKRTAWVRK